MQHNKANQAWTWYPPESSPQAEVVQLGLGWGLTLNSLSANSTLHHPQPTTINHKICPSRRVTFYTHHSGSCQAGLRHANKRWPGLQIKTCPICRIYTSAHHNKSFLPQGGKFLPPNLPFVSSSLRCKSCFVYNPIIKHFCCGMLWSPPNILVSAF